MSRGSGLELGSPTIGHVEEKRATEEDSRLRDREGIMKATLHLVLLRELTGAHTQKLKPPCQQKSPFLIKGLEMKGPYRVAASGPCQPRTMVPILPSPPPLTFPSQTPPT